MGTLHFQTHEQQIIFSEVAKNEYFRARFYFTGGTALSAYYLHHRYSDDLDFFTEQRFDNQVVLTFMQEHSSRHHYSLQAHFVEVTYIFDLLFSSQNTLKVDFAFYPYQRIEKETQVEGMYIDSLFDIAINKVFTISQRTNVKDFVDLYFLLQDFSLWDLIQGAQIKFNMEIDPLLLASDFLKADDFTFLPRMIKPLTLEELQAFYQYQAKVLGRQSVE